MKERAQDLYKIAHLEFLRNKPKSEKEKKISLLDGCALALSFQDTNIKKITTENEVYLPQKG